MVLLNALIEEGVKTSMYYGQEINLKHNVRCGLITSITPALYKQQFRQWNDIGFLSRFITVSYKYSEETRRAIMQLIAGNGKESFDSELTKMRKGGGKDIKINKDISAGLTLYAEELVKKLRGFHVVSEKGNARYKIFLDIQGFRLMKQLQLLIKAIAFDKNLREANYECLAELKDLLEYVSMPDMPKVI